jgi:Domain of unknown function (DUF4412)
MYLAKYLQALPKHEKPMKKLITIILLFAAFGSKAQGFEGTVKWTMKMEVTDPKLKAEMDQAQQKMNDPATQAKMKEAEAAMNDPKIKAMMDANPQMKAQMEARMKMMQGGSAGGAMGMASGAPMGFTIKIKGGDRLTLMEGPMAQEVLFMKSKNESVKLDRANKTYSILPSGGTGMGRGGNTAASVAAPKVTKTSETMTILGYKCTKYVVEMTDAGRTITQNIWTTTDIKDFDSKSLSSQRMGQGQSIFYDGMEGVPMKVESSTKEGSMVMEVSEVKRESLSASDFTIPSDFKEVKMGGGY